MGTYPCSTCGATADTATGCPSCGASIDAELATLDVGLRAAEKKNVAMLAAFRPWVSSMFQEIKPKSL